MSRAYECDRCGMLFKPYKNQKTSNFLNITKNPNMTGNCLDLCPKCNDKLQEWVKNTDEEIAKSFIEDIETVKMKTNTHIVIKREDIFKYLTDNQIKYLDAVLNTIADGRKKEGKKPDNSYYICNTDEPYADEVREVILKSEREDK